MSPSVIKAEGLRSPRHRTTFGADSQQTRRRGGEAEGKRGKKSWGETYRGMVTGTLPAREPVTETRDRNPSASPGSSEQLPYTALLARQPLAQLAAETWARPPRHPGCALPVTPRSDSSALTAPSTVILISLLEKNTLPNHKTK